MDELDDLIRLRDLAVAEDNYELFKEVKGKLDELCKLSISESEYFNTGS